MISIKGVKVDNVQIKQGDKGEFIVTGSYSIISSSDKVIATQSFNDYSEIKVGLSQETQKALENFSSLLKTDVEITTGLKGGE